MSGPVPGGKDTDGTPGVVLGGRGAVDRCVGRWLGVVRAEVLGVAADVVAEVLAGEVGTGEP
jgi:hypothetical protein